MSEKNASTSETSPDEAAISESSSFKCERYAGRVAIITGAARGLGTSVAKRLAAVDCLVVQDLFASPLLDLATYRLPSAAFAEREGSYVNHADRLQSVAWAIRPPAGVRTELGVYWELLTMPGLPKARRVLDEVAAQIGFYSPAIDPVGPLGMDLQARPRVEAAV